MDINKIKFVPQANAFSDVYAKATGMPFVGEMMAAAAGNGGEPTPPTPSVVESVTVFGEQEEDEFNRYYDICALVTFSQDFVSEYCKTFPSFTIEIKDSSNTTICELWGALYECETKVFDACTSGTGTLPTLPESGNYSIVVTTESESETIYEGTGTWTNEDQTI